MSVNFSFGVGDALQVIDAIKNWFNAEQERISFEAWKYVSFREECDELVRYYELNNTPLFAYPSASGSKIKVPLYVRPEWLVLNDERLKIKLFEGFLPPYEPNKHQKKFLDFYQQMRVRTGRGETWDSTVFRLVNFETSSNIVRMEFGEGKFWDSVKCHYVLEHELLSQIRKNPNRRKNFKLRDRVAKNAEAIEKFYTKNVCRIGVSNLLIMNTKEGYTPFIQQRGSNSLAVGFDTVSSGIFDIVTTVDADITLRHKVLVEVGEELFDYKDLIRSQGFLNPRFFYPWDGINDLIELFENGGASFYVTGLCIDLIRLVPEITTLLIIQDPTYYQEHSGYGSRVEFKLNSEYDSALRRGYHISKIDDIDDYFAYEIPTLPAGNKHGFDSQMWTLPGGFCYYQGLKRAVELKLLG